MRAIDVHADLTQSLHSDRDVVGIVGNHFPQSRYDAVIQVILASGLSGLIFSGFGGLIYGFYSLCLENFSKANVFFSTATTSLR